MGRIAMARVVALVALVATWLSFQQPCTAATTSTAAEASYAYSSPHVPIAQTTDHYDRGPPAAYNRPSAYDAVTRWPRAASTRPEGPTHPGETIDNDLAKSVQGVQVTGTTAEPAGRTGWDLSSVPRAGVAAKTVPSTALRPVGSVLGHVDDVMKNPHLLEGVSPAQLESIMRGTPGWEFGTLGRGRSAGSGWTARELNASGTDYTGRYIQWSPGSPRHFDGAPYWKISSGELGTVRFPQ